MQLLIGFEFEFGWLPETNKKHAPYFMGETVFREVRKNLKDFFQDDFSFVKTIEDDVSISFPKTEPKDYYGVEVVTKPMLEDVAIQFCKKMLYWMKNNSRVSTNKTCSLHVNMSIKEKTINQKLDYFSILQLTPQNEILTQYGRTNNSYCKSTKEMKFNLTVGSYATKSRNFEYWLNKVKIGKTTMNTVKPNLYGFNVPKSQIQKKTIEFKDKIIWAELIKERYLSSLEHEEKAIAIVEKMSPENIRYFEFRMIGNTNYHLRWTEIKKNINSFKQALKKSIKPIDPLML
jgi:hypothetical protein